MSEDKCCTFLRGDFYMAEAKASCDSTGGLVCGIEAPLRKMGNIQSAVINIQSDIQGAENKYNSEGTNPCARIGFVNATITLSLLCSKQENLKLSLQSKSFVPSPTSGYVQEFKLCDALSFQTGNLFLYEKSGVDTATSVVQVLDVSNVVIQTLVKNVDYSETPHGIELLQDITTVGAVYLRITYDYDDTEFDEFNFLSEFKGPKYLYFKGTNFEDEDEMPFGVEIYRVYFTPVSQLDLISQGNYFVLNLTGQIEKSFDNEDLGLGGYFKLRR